MQARKHMLIFRPEHDSHGKKDVTYAFKPEAAKYLKAVCTRDSRIVVINNRLSFAKRWEQVSKALAEADKAGSYYDGVAFFCHGWKSGIQLGANNKNVWELADRIHRLCEHSFPCVPLYCCSTGGDVKTKSSSPATGDNSYADRLRDSLCEVISTAGMSPYPRIFAHETVAHATKNPRVRLFDGQGSSEGGVGGYRPVKIRGRLWRIWRAELQAKKGSPQEGSDFRFWVPHLDIPEIEAWLEEAS